MRDLLAHPLPPWEERKVVWTAGAYNIEQVRTQWDFELEGYYLAHCIGTKEADVFGIYHRVFSVRERDTGFPHCTVLCVTQRRHSEYGACSDLGTHRPFQPIASESGLRVLQVRGRYDALAKPEYLSIVAQWYAAKGGKLRIPLRSIQAFSERRGDNDNLYHYMWLMSETNEWTFAHWRKHA